MRSIRDGTDLKVRMRILAELAPWPHRYYARRLPLAMTDDPVQDVLLAIHGKLHTYDPSRLLIIPKRNAAGSSACLAAQSGTEPEREIDAATGGCAERGNDGAPFGFAFHCMSSTSSL
jgi:hypothetical protein